MLNSNIDSTTFSLAVPTHNFYVDASVSATPAIFGDYVIFPSFNGYLYAYSKSLNTLLWSVNIKSAYYPKLTVQKVVSRTTPVMYGTYMLVGILGPADILKIEISTGNLVGRVLLSAHIAALVTMSGTVYINKFYIGVSSKEESLAASETYTCCSFGGSFHAVNIDTMEIAWSWAAIPGTLLDPRSSRGTQSGGPVPLSTPT